MHGGASPIFRDRLATTDPSNAGWRRDLAVSHGKMGSVLAQQGELAGALAEFAKGRDIIARLKEQSPESASLAHDLAGFDAQIEKWRRANAPLQDAAPEQAAQ